MDSDKLISISVGCCMNIVTLSDLTFLDTQDFFTLVEQQGKIIAESLFR